MYIAGRWLLGLGLSMWVAMCSFDEVLKSNNEIAEGLNFKPVGFIYENITIPAKKESKVHIEKFQNNRKQWTIGLHYFMFFAGALVVSLFNKKNEILLFTKSKILKIDFFAFIKSFEYYLNKTALKFGVAILKCRNLFTEKSNEFTKMLSKSLLDIFYSKSNVTQKRLNLLLLKKLKEFAEEKKNLAQLLLAAIQENKHIKMQHQLESMARNRLARHIENTQKEMKKNRSTYVSFHQLYLVMQQENIFLKQRIVKLTKEKGEAEKNLKHIMDEVYKSNNNELKTYCYRFIVRAKDTLIGSDVNEKIQIFLKKSPKSVSFASNYHICEQCDVEVNTAYSWTRYNDTMSTDVIQDENNLLSLVSYQPKLKGLPGEIVWTVKDKNGLTEKLYEYDYGSEFDNGDTIRRIREYSVYYDKDCLLDYRNSRTIIQGASNPGMYRNQTNNVLPQTSRKFLTGSQAFQQFLQSNKNIVRSSRSKPPQLLCG